jgi:hypothetical protein
MISWDYPFKLSPLYRIIPLYYLFLCVRQAAPIEVEIGTTVSIPPPSTGWSDEALAARGAYKHFIKTYFIKKR